MSKKKDFAVGIDNLYSCEAENEEEAMKTIREYIRDNPREVLDDLILTVVDVADPVFESPSGVDNYE